MLYYVYFANQGVAKTGLTPTFSTLASAENGTTKITTYTGVAGEIDFVDGVALADTITDDSSGLAVFAAGQWIRPSNSDSNDGTVFNIVSVVAGTITLATGTVVAETSAAAITLTTPAIKEIDATNCPGWYAFKVIPGTKPWDTLTEDLVGIIDGGAGVLADVDRYKPVSVTLRGLGLAVLGHTFIQTKATGDAVVYATDGSTGDFKLDMTNVASTITRATAAPA